MKTKLKIIIAGMMTIVACSSMNCHKTTETPAPPPPDCSGTDQIENSSINVLDPRVGSPYQNQNIATFKFAQTYKTYLSACNKQDSYGGIALTITNNLNKTIQVPYSITATSIANITTVQYQNTTTIPPNGSVLVGNIYNGPVKLTSQKVLIGVGVINYN